METNDTVTIRKRDVFFRNLKSLLTDDKNKYGHLFYFCLLAAFCLVIFLIIEIVSACYGGYFNISSDDTIQYYPYVAAFFEKIKSGSLSLYDPNLYGGVSAYSALYYVPIDAYTITAFFLSFIVRGEYAYAAMNLLRPITGALLLYYVFQRKGYRPLVCFLTGLMFLSGGLVEAYYIFPVYLGICCYVPLGMFLVDMFIEKRKYSWYLLPLYAFVVILYDFYIAYMLLAFFCFYWVIEMHLRGKLNFFRHSSLVKKEFWLEFLKFIGLTLLGVMMGAVILIPAMLYILHGSARTEGTADYLWYFTRYGSGKLYWGHYFMQLINMFIPNEPHVFCLVPAGAYVREHASLYITAGGALYLAYFFFLRDKAANRLKVWVLIFNIAFLIPVFCMFFSVSNCAYVRWFFMPLTINLYAASMAMEKHKMLINGKFSKAASLLMVLLGFTAILLVMTVPYFTARDADGNTTFETLFTHYEYDYEDFWMVLTPGLVACSCYIAFLIFAIVDLFTKKKTRKVMSFIYRIGFPSVIICECIMGWIVIMYNLGSGPSYYENKDGITTLKNTLKSEGYSDTSGYRINLYTNNAKAITNANLLIGGVNYGKFFQSFYNDNLNVCLSTFYGENDDDWSRNFTSGYSLLSTPVWNVKYIVAWEDKNMNLPTKYYVMNEEKDHYCYYENTSATPFMVLDKAICEASYFTNLANKQEALLNYAYIPHYSIVSDDGETKVESEDYLATIEAGMTYYERADIYSGISSADGKSLTYKGIDEETGYRVYDLTFLFTSAYQRDDYTAWKYDAMIVKPCNDIRRQAYDNIYIRDTEGNLHKAHYDNLYLNNYDEDGKLVLSYTPKELLVKSDKDSYNTSVTICGYNFSIYDKYLESQSVYTNEYFELSGSTMKIKCTMPDTAKTRIIKTAYSYSSEWQCEGYQTVNVDGGFLGILIPKDGETDIDITLKFVPEGYKPSLLLSVAGIGAYVVIGAVLAVKIVLKRKRKKNQEELTK